jgi:hypothetical protein
MKEITLSAQCNVIVLTQFLIGISQFIDARKKCDVSMADNCWRLVLLSRAASPGRHAALKRPGGQRRRSQHNAIVILGDAGAPFGDSDE